MNVNEEIYYYQDSTELLNAIFTDKKNKNKKYSLRAWAKKLDVTAMTLSRAMRGLTPCSKKVLANIAKELKLSEKQSQYFYLLNELQYAREPQEKEYFRALLKSLSPLKNTIFYSLDTFKVIAEWYHGAILEMTSLKDFKDDPDYIAKRLGHNLSAKTVSYAIERLCALGLLKRTQLGLKAVRGEQLKTGDLGTSLIVKRYHSQFLELAQKALYEQSTDEQRFFGTTLTIKKKSIPQLNDLVDEFHKKVCDLMATDTGDETYQINVNYFRLTNKRE